VTKLEVDSRGRVLQTLGHEDPVQGRDIQLTIDLDVQELTEESLARGLEAARQAWDRDQLKHFIAPAGAVVVQDPRDGSVLAMASNPTFDPSSFVNGIEPGVFKQLQDPAGHFPLNNRAIQGLYAPGSTFKLVTAMAGLRTGLIGAHTTIDDKGELRVGNRTFRNAGRKVWGKVDVTRALSVSSDVFFYDLGYKFWLQKDRYPDGIQKVAREMGLGQRSDILLPSEREGRVPDPATRKRLHEKFPKAFPFGDWFGGDNVNLAIGQGEMVITPLQLANLYSTFANGGSLYRPRLAARSLDQAGEAVEDLGPVKRRLVDIPPNVRDPVLAGLRGVISNDEGTAHLAFGGFSGMSVAGKTGTAQVLGKQDTAVFAAFAPVEAPRYTVAVVMEEGGFGGETAAPVARRILSGLAGQPPGEITLGGGVVD
ncbi:MAG TPA: penicillin-binding transpeptidase domain-containing protein, partial [Acidimicrobiales bacterium]|nr:penicillin-binding transpeptidase domain-containing protein [Acidimicrobiales bacterium]